MARRKRRRSVKLPATIGLAAVLLASLLITASPKLDLPFYVPTWQEIFSAVDLEGDQTAHVSDGQLGVHFVDVGQADCTLLQYGEHAALVDAGNNADGPAVVQYLEDAGVTKLDFVIGTHPHEDHIGGLDDVINHFDVEKVILPQVPDSIVPTTKTYEDVLEAVKNKGLSITKAQVGDTYSIGEASLEILGPAGTFDDLNNESVVSRVEFGRTSFLLTGDAEEPAEQAILETGADLTSTVLKVGHHGSRTSSSDAFLDAVSPSYGVILCGAGNDYGHPHEEAVNRLEQHGVKLYRTDVNGTVVFVSDGKNVTVKTQKAG